jgi:ankyrin repeat protein
MQRPVHREPIHRAARKGDVAELRRLLDEGSSLHVYDGHCETPLHNLFNGEENDDRVACFELLREAGANLEARTGGWDPQGHTVLHCAARGYPRMMSLLIEAGVNVNVANSGGCTPLHWARWSPKCVELLLKAGAALNARDNGGSTPFDTALNSGHRRTWPLFLRAGAEISPGCHFTWYLVRIQRAGGYRKYAQNHLAAMTKLFAANGRRLPPEVVRQIMKFWLHLGYY